MGWDPSPRNVEGVLFFSDYLSAVGRVVGIDFGLKRIGVASTDPLRLIVNGKGTYSSDDILTFLTNFILTEGVDEIVIGYFGPAGYHR